MAGLSVDCSSGKVTLWKNGNFVRVLGQLQSQAGLRPLVSLGPGSECRIRLSKQHIRRLPSGVRALGNHEMAHPQVCSACKGLCRIFQRWADDSSQLIILQQPITGLRYLCLQCQDFNLCATCYSVATDYHSDQHVFLVIFPGYDSNLALSTIDTGGIWTLYLGLFAFTHLSQ